MHYSRCLLPKKNVVSLTFATLFSLSFALQCAQAQEHASVDVLTGQGRYIEVWDPPPFVTIGDQRQEFLQTAQEVPECPPFLFRNSLESGQLSQAGGAGTPILFSTASGYLVKVDRHTITLQDPYAMNAVQSWGDPHENLNGKHVKDWGGLAGWDDARRTIVLNGGTKVTMDAAGATGVVLYTSIYDGDQNVQIENTTNIILHHGTDAADTNAREAAQYDGETGSFTTDAQSGVAHFDNVHNEDSNFVVSQSTVPIGSTGGCASPGQVNDYFPPLP